LNVRRLTDECGNFEMAIAHVRFTLLCFITVVEYDVPKELRPDFQEVRIDLLPRFACSSGAM
jgi:hypothetical protein